MKILEKIFRIFLKTILKIITPFFIHDKKKRKEFIRHVARSSFSFSSLSEAKRFRTASSSKKSVLIMESNDFHSEFALGYAEYFVKLGYHVDIVVVPSQLKMRPFKLNAMKGVDFYGIDELFFKPILSSRTIDRYSHVFFVSAFSSAHGCITRYLDGRTYPKTFSVLHTEFQLEIEDIRKLYDDEKLTVITNLSNDKKLFEVTPHYFGPIPPKPKSKKVTNFIFIGLIDPKKRNTTLLIKAVQKLAQTGFTDFKITVLSRKKSKETFPNELLPYFDFKIGLDYGDMYEEIKKSDFFLILLDPKNKEQRGYLTSMTSGSQLLSLGFLRPALMNDAFAKGYGLNSRNAVPYKGEALFEAMQRACRMSAEDYSTMQKMLSELSAAKKKSGLLNLKKMLG